LNSIDIDTAGESPQVNLTMEHTIPLVGDGESSGGVMSPRLDMEKVKNEKKGRKNKDLRKDHL